MMCPACGLANDPARSVCARCNTGLTAQAEGGSTLPFGPPPRSRQPTTWMIAGLAVAVIVLSMAGVAVLVYLHGKRGGTGGTPPVAATATAAVATGSAQKQATDLDKVLNASAQSRAKLNRAIAKVQGCTQLSQAVSDMRTVGDERTSQLKTVESAAVDQLPNGEKLRSTLRDALNYALQADQGYLAWAEPTPANGCGDTAARKAAFGRGQTASTKAGTAKESFLTLWNPVAADLDLRTRTRQEI